MPTKSKQPSVCIVTLNWNGLADTLAALEAVYALEYDNYRVVVVDNGSADGEAARIKKDFPAVRLIANEENLGFTGGSNQGIEEALKTGADYVLLLNNDTIVTPDFLGKLVAFYEATPTAGMVSPLILYTDKKRLWFGGAKVKMGLIRHSHKGQLIKSVALPGAPFVTDYVPGTAMLISCKLIRKIGKLDDRYFAYYEDLDWCWKAQRLGYGAYVVPDALIYHKKSGSTSQGGHRKFNKIPAYYMARNSLLLADNFHGFRKGLFILAQLGIKLPLTIALLVNHKAWGSYLRGTGAGLAADVKALSRRKP